MIPGIQAIATFAFRRKLVLSRNTLVRSENLALVLALAAMAVIPLIEIILRATLHTGISAAAALVQHLVLVAGMLGATIAAREHRLLALSTVHFLLPESAAKITRIFSGSFGVLISAFLCVASMQFVLAEKDGGNLLAYGIPLWTVQFILPIGFALITLRLLNSSANQWTWRIFVILFTAVMAGAAITLPIPADSRTYFSLIVLLIATFLGTPMFVTLGGAALILFWGDGLPIASIPLDHYRLVMNSSLPMIPLFTLAGYFLAESGAPGRLIRVFQALFGGIKGGAAIVVVLVCVFFTSFTGASGVTILALGGMLMPLLFAEGYREKSALGLLTSAGSLGGLLPPGLPLVLYAIVAKAPIQEMFLGGLIPCLVMVSLITWWGMRQAPKNALIKNAIDWDEVRQAVVAAKWEMMLPVVAFGGLFSGLATPVEAAALTAVYAFVIETFVHHDLKLKRDVPQIMVECGLLAGGILLILGVALSFTNYLVDAQVPDHVVEWVKSSIDSRWVFLLALNVFLLLVGCLMDIFSAIIVVVPLITPIGNAFDIDPVHLGIIFLVNMELGYLTPPVGMNLFFASSRFGKPLAEVCHAVVPPVLLLAAGVVLITYVPALSTFLPQLVK